MNLRAGIFRFLTPLFLIGSALGAVEGWFMDKGISHRQGSDAVQSTTATGWFIEIAVETSNPGDFASVSISRVGSNVNHPFELDGGEWVFERDYGSEAAMEAEFPSSSSYTITALGGAGAGSSEFCSRAGKLSEHSLFKRC